MRKLKYFSFELNEILYDLWKISLEIPTGKLKYLCNIIALYNYTQLVNSCFNPVGYHLWFFKVFTT